MVRGASRGPHVPEVYTYTDAISYDPGDEVTFHSSATAKTWRLQIYRDGLEPEMLHEADALEGVFAPTPADAYRNGCQWPVSYRLKLPSNLRSGFYPGGFLLRARERRPIRPAPLLRRAPDRGYAARQDPYGPADRHLDCLQRFRWRQSLLRC